MGTLTAPTITDHGGLTGLGDDDHTQYLLLAGRAGGQIVYGGNAANDDLILEGTSHGTKTTSYVILQLSGGNVGIGTTTPEAPLDIFAGSSGNIFQLRAKAVEVPMSNS